MNKNLQKLLCLTLCLLFCLALLPSCQRADPLAQNGIRSVEIVKKGKKAENLDILVTINSSLLEAHKKDRICLYELFPGEDLYDLADKKPVDEKKANGSVKFRIPMKENGVNRLYSTFVVAFSDGTLISEKAMGAKNPESLASITGRFPWSGTPTGLISDNMEAGWSMGATPTVVSVRLSEILGGTDLLRFNDRQYTYSLACCNELYDRLYQAQKTGAQVTLELILDIAPDLEAVTAILDHVSSDQTLTPDVGFLSAYMITPEGEIGAAYTADVMRLARLSMISRVSNGRTLVHLKDRSYSKTTEYFANLSRELSLRGVTAWGAAVSPDCSGAPWESGEEDLLSVDKLPSLFQFLNKGDLTLSPSYLAVMGLSYSASDEDLQAAKLAYAYRLSVNAGASMVFYDETLGSEYALAYEDGTPRRAKTVFEKMDMALSDEDLAKVEALTLGNYSKLSETVSRKELVGSATVGSDGQKNTLLFDFSDQHHKNFSAVNGMMIPEVIDSDAMGHAVLYTWLKATAEGGEGLRRYMANGKELENAFSISLCLLLQNLETPTSTVTLRLDGISKNGSQRISFEASAELTNDSCWQTAIFYIGSFVAEADLSQPCVLTVTADTESPEGTEYVLWLDSITVRKPERQLGAVVTVLIAVGAVALSCILILLLYKLSTKKKRAARYRR